MEIGAYAEQLTERTTYEDNSPSSKYESSFVAPTLSLSMMGSVYHPNFLQFVLLTDGGYGWGTRKSKQATGDSVEQVQYYGMFRGNAMLLPGKPTSGWVFGDYGRTHRDYDFFTRTTVDSLNYGANVTHQSPAFRMSSHYTHTEEQVNDTSSSYRSFQDMFKFDASRYRVTGSTAFDYTFSQSRYSDQAGDGPRTHALALSDSERLGARQADLQSSVTYTHEEADPDSSDQVTGTASLGVEHTPSLGSRYAAAYDHFEIGDLSSDSASGSASLSHQLYESLSSSLTADGSASDSSDADSSGYARQFGTTWTESYRKRLGANHRLQLDNSLTVSHSDQQSGGRVVNERHAFPLPPLPESFLLGQPRVIESSIVISDGSGARLYVRGIDYEVFPSGSRLEIRRIPGGRIPQGGSVLVDYEASPGGSGGYETIGDRCGIRLDFWANLWGIYGRYYTARDNASAYMSTLEQTRYTYGTDFTWEFFQGVAEREISESEGASYEANRLSESFSFSPDPLSGFSIRLAQSFTRYRDADRYERDYLFLSTYRRLFSRNLEASASAGLDMRDGEGVDQHLAVFRPAVRYTYGLTRIEVTYDREYNEYLHQQKRDKQQFTVSLKRSF